MRIFKVTFCPLAGLIRAAHGASAFTCRLTVITAYLNGVGDVPASLPGRDFGLVLIQRASCLQGRGPPAGAVPLVVAVPLQPALPLHVSPFLFSLKDIHLHPLPVVIIQVVALGEAQALLVRRGLEAQPGEHPADLGLGFVGHRVGRVGQLVGDLVSY